ncbi:MAG: aldo/keto reductase [Desulfobacterota bacterium]|nr:aldo/keto reductase [Thermodesulfobacteriota bacterium]
MKTITLGTTGLQTAELGFGAMYLPRVSVAQSERVIKRALELGITYFDTAAAYQDSEEKLGKVLSKISDQVIVSSRSMAYKMGIEAFQQEFDQSLRRLRCDYFDFYGFHAVNQPPDFEQAIGAPLEFLREQQQRGRVRHIAITGHNPVTLVRALKTGAFAMAMFPFNVIEQEPLHDLFAVARELGVATSIMKPLAGGVIERKALAFRFFFTHDPGVITPGMASEQEVEENVRIFIERRPLVADELQELLNEVALLGKEFCRRCSYCMPCEQGIMIPFVHMIYLKCWGKPMNDDVLYTLGLGKRMLPLLEKCTACGTCVEKCPYSIPTPRRVQEVLELLKSMPDELS